MPQCTAPQQIRQVVSARHNSDAETTMPNSSSFALVKALLERPIAFHPCLAVLTGSIASGLMLSQSVYWALRTKDPNGWFYKTQEDWQNEIFLNRTEQTNARQKLRVFAFWQEKKKGVPGKLYYRVDLDLLAEALNGKYADVTLEQVLTECARTLKQLSRAGYMRASKAKVVLEKVDYAEVLKAKGMICGICKKKIVHPVGQKPGFLVFDHIIPIAKQGSHTFKNLQPAHVECNARKSTSLDHSQFAYSKQTRNLTVSKQECLPEANLSASPKQTLPYRTETTSETTAESSSRRGANTRKSKAAAASQFTKLEILEFLFVTKPGNANRNAGLAHKLWQTGEDDYLVEMWLAEKKEMAARQELQDLQRSKEAVQNALVIADEILEKFKASDREWIPSLIETLSTHPDHSNVVTQLKGLL